MKEYLFDVKLFAAVRVKAETEQEARNIVSGIDSASVSFDDGITGEASVDGTADLVEVDGEEA